VLDKVVPVCAHPQFRTVISTLQNRLVVSLIPGFLANNVITIQRRILLDIAAHPPIRGCDRQSITGSIVSGLGTRSGNPENYLQLILACSEAVWHIHKEGNLLPQSRVTSSLIKIINLWIQMSLFSVFWILVSKTLIEA
jgi:hypothetical protein